LLPEGLARVTILDMAAYSARTDEPSLGPGPPAGRWTPFGPLSPAAYARLFPEPVVRVIETRPLQFILSFLGYSIDDIVSSRQARAWVRVLWRAFKASQRLARENLEEGILAEELWWRDLGCPVPCPLCAAADPCNCGRKQRWSFEHRERKEALPSGNA
jgi:hypothetical protein